VAPEDGDIPDLFTSSGGSASWLRGGNEGRCAWALNRDDPCLTWDQVGPAPASFQIDAGTERTILEYIADTPGDTDFRFADLITGPGPTSSTPHPRA
jgi:hypothetical protein